MMAQQGAGATHCTPGSVNSHGKTKLIPIDPSEIPPLMLNPGQNNTPDMAPSAPPIGSVPGMGLQDAGERRSSVSLGANGGNANGVNGPKGKGAVGPGPMGMGGRPPLPPGSKMRTADSADSAGVSMVNGASVVVTQNTYTPHRGAPGNHNVGGNANHNIMNSPLTQIMNNVNGAGANANPMHKDSPLTQIMNKVNGTGANSGVNPNMLSSNANMVRLHSTKLSIFSIDFLP